MKWESMVSRLEREAQDALSDPTLSWAAERVIGAAKALRQERPRGRIDHALDKMLSLCSAYEDLWVAKATDYRGPQLTRVILRDLKRGVHATSRLRRSTEKGAPAVQRAKGQAIADRVRECASQLRKDGVPGRQINKRIASRLRLSVRQVTYALKIRDTR